MVVTLMGIGQADGCYGVISKLSELFSGYAEEIQVSISNDQITVCVKSHTYPSVDVYFDKFKSGKRKVKKIFCLNHVVMYLTPEHQEFYDQFHKLFPDISKKELFEYKDMTFLGKFEAYVYNICRSYVRECFLFEVPEGVEIIWQGKKQSSVTTDETLKLNIADIDSQGDKFINDIQKLMPCN